MVQLIPIPACVSLAWPSSSTEKSKVLVTAEKEAESTLLTFLAHFEKPGVSPPSSRVYPLASRKEQEKISLWHAYKYARFLASKSKDLATAFLSHIIFGPPRPSWGLEMTLISAMMRNANSHSALADLSMLRSITGLAGHMPLPSDAHVAPVSFRVRPRNLGGILKDLDRAEDGTRELSGEWVVGKRLWRRLQHQYRSASSSSTKKSASAAPHRIVYYIHGGAYYLSSAAAQRTISIPLSHSLSARVFALDYRLAPEATFPGPLHDAVQGYLRLVQDLHVLPERIVLAGDSAGGGLASAMLMYLRDEGLPMPGCTILMSPWVDLTLSCASWEENKAYDLVPMPISGDHLDPIALYLGPSPERVASLLTHPYASPLFGDVSSLPPVLIQAGEAEVLRDECALFAHKIGKQGGKVRHEVYEDMVHIFQAYPFLDAAKQAFSSMREFVKREAPALVRREGPGMEAEEDEGPSCEVSKDIKRGDSEAVRVRRTGEVEKEGESVTETEAEAETSERRVEEDEAERLWNSVDEPEPAIPGVVEMEEKWLPASISRSQPHSPTSKILPSPPTSEDEGQRSGLPSPPASPITVHRALPHAPRPHVYHAASYVQPQMPSSGPDKRRRRSNSASSTLSRISTALGLSSLTASSPGRPPSPRTGKSLHASRRSSNAALHPHPGPSSPAVERRSTTTLSEKAPRHSAPRSRRSTTSLFTLPTLLNAVTGTPSISHIRLNLASLSPQIQQREFKPTTHAGSQPPSPSVRRRHSGYFSAWGAHHTSPGLASAKEGYVYGSGKELEVRTSSVDRFEKGECHPDVGELVKDWERGPGNRTVVYRGV